MCMRLRQQRRGVSPCMTGLVLRGALRSARGGSRRGNHSTTATTIPATTSGLGKHLDSAAQTELDARLEAVVGEFHAPVRFAIAYGSGVFRQKGYKPTAVGSKEAPMVDFLFGVTHPDHWHSLNIRQNRHHYSSLAYFGSKVVSNVQEKMGAGLYFNPDVHVAGLRIKYGVVSMDRLIRDLHDWETLYLAGRLQKPVKVLRTDARVTLANRRNLRASVRAALLLLPSEFSEEELFCAIAGDFRMKMGENPHKVFNIVYSQMDSFRELYKPIIEDLPNVNYVSESQLVQDLDARLRSQAVQKLPKHLHNKMYQYHQAALLRSGDAAASLAEIVRWPAIAQSLKGILTAGFSRALIYAKNKLKKSFAARPPAQTNK
ncbi:phosphatidate cytidylyltransferase [Powellomyces hirtus]|uniref:Phosphatidate cytidylyltransferase, mitochondrial n=1 Tax=Powellomyces hirtus TaxID=109895 RepID=A0A507E5W6_9FUNG|nr:phosphatidate cytidylyltransferase [Powellomyces hirtus]